MSGRVFVNLETGTVDGLDGSAYCIDVELLDDGQRSTLESCEDFGSFPPDAVRVVESVAMPLEVAVDIVDALRRVAFPVASSRSPGWVGVGTLRSAVSMIAAPVGFVEGSVPPALLEVRDAAVVELRRALLILDTLASRSIDAAAELDALEVNPSGLRSALEELDNGTRGRLSDLRADLEARVRAEILNGGTLEDWARGEGYRRRNGGWVNECDDDVTLEDELDDEVRRVSDLWESLGVES